MGPCREAKGGCTAGLTQWLRLMISLTLPPGSRRLQALPEQAAWAVSAALECWAGTFLIRADPFQQETRPRRCCQSQESHILQVRGSTHVCQHTFREAKGGALAYRAVRLACGWRKEKHNCSACSSDLCDFWCMGKLWWYQVKRHQQAWINILWKQKHLSYYKRIGRMKDFNSEIMQTI